MARYDGRYISHMRSEDRDFWDSLEEVLRIGREAEIPVQISHMKLAMKSLWGRASEAEAGARGTSMIGTSMTTEDIATFMAWPHTNISSDGGLRGSHPRGFGSYPRVLASMARERGDLTLEGAIYRMSGAAAAHMGLADRGVIRPGAHADLVLFDAERVQDRATPEDPHARSVGIEVVWVNGAEVYRSGEITGERPGVVLTRTGSGKKLAG